MHRAGERDKAKASRLPLTPHAAPYRELECNFFLSTLPTRDSRLRLSASSPLKAAHSLLMKTLRISFGYIQFFAALALLLVKLRKSNIYKLMCAAGGKKY